MAKKRIVKDKDGKQVEIDQDAIEAALAKAVTNADGSHPKQEKPYSPMDGKKNSDKPWFAKENLEAAEAKTPQTPSEELDASQMCVGADIDEELKDENKNEEPDDTNTERELPIAMNQQQFVDACYNMNINAKHCFYQSSKNKDKSIVEYVRSINKKIYDETQKGGYSTNIQFRVTPQDWVNVSHILDWYKAHGFQILNYGQTSPQYGRNAGDIQYNFTISWSEA